MGGGLVGGGVGEVWGEGLWVKVRVGEGEGVEVVMS